MLTSLIGLTTVYAVLAVVEVFLMVRFIRGGVESVMPPDKGEDEDDDVLSFAY